jgi:hypothetical protein
MIAAMSGVGAGVRALLGRQRADALCVLARFYPLPPDLLRHPAWRATSLHENGRLPWGEPLDAREPRFAIDFARLSRLGGSFWEARRIERHAERWDWTALSANPSLPWSRRLIERFADRWDWAALSGNRGIPFDEELIGAFEARWVVARLAASTAVRWDAALVKRLASRLDEPDPDWHPSLEAERPVPVAPGITLGESGWVHLMQNPSVAWDEVLPLVPAPRWALLSANPGLPWSEAFIARHRAELVPGALCRNRAVPWTEERAAALLDGAEERLQLSANPALPWSDAFVRRHADRLVWRVLSANPGVPWTVSLLEAHEERIGWERLSASGALGPEVLDRYADRLDWATGVSCNRVLPWTVEIVARHAARFDWERLGWNGALPWGDALLERFAGRWVVRSFERNEAAWTAVGPHLDDAWVRALVG